MPPRIINLPSAFDELPRVTLPPYTPRQSTMDLFDSEPDALWKACNLWLEWSLHPPEEPYDFEQLSEALQLWAVAHGLGYAELSPGFVALIKNKGVRRVL